MTLDALNCCVIREKRGVDDRGRPLAPEPPGYEIRWGKNTNDEKHDREPAHDIAAVNLKTLYFRTRSEFLDW